MENGKKSIPNKTSEVGWGSYFALKSTGIQGMSTGIKSFEREFRKLLNPPTLLQDYHLGGSTLRGICNINHALKKDVLGVKFRFVGDLKDLAETTLADPD